MRFEAALDGENAYAHPCRPRTREHGRAKMAGNDGRAHARAEETAAVSGTAILQKGVGFGQL